jgi:hypothetical protein
MTDRQQFGTHEPETVMTAHGGVQQKYKFPNGFGASVVRHDFSYGGPQGLWELAVLGPNGHLTYETPITDDVLGYLSEAEVTATLDRIAALERVSA